MHNTPQWILVQYVPQPVGKDKKFPIDWRTGHKSDAHDPAIWLEYQRARELAATFGAGYGIGFVLTAADPYFFYDVDGALQADGQWSPLALDAVARFPGAYVEVSHSGQGIHIIGSYAGAAPPHSCRDDRKHIEFYTELRFCAVTGLHARGDATADCTAAVVTLIAEHFPPAPEPMPGTPDTWTTGPCEGWNGPTDDAELLRRARNSRSAASLFGGRASFADLYDGNVPVLAATYPPDPGSGNAYNPSNADMALACHFMFWTGRDCERIERLMRGSELRRAKWDDRGDYLRERTILPAMRISREVLTDRTPEAAPVPPVASVAPRQTPVTGGTILSPAEQERLFAGCVYVLDAHRVLMPGGELLKPEQFRTQYGGYTFIMDLANDKTSKDAFEAFTQSQALRPPIAAGTCFRPDLPPATMIVEDGRQLVNTYWPVDVPRRAGDASRFLDHLKRVLPVERDREILLAYMCAIVQHKGVKFQWAPLLQGAEGNGKTLFTRCVMAAVGRRYTHMPRADEISEKFNSWLFGNIFVGVEDVFVVSGKHELFEILKPMVTGDYLAKRAMNTDQVMGNVCCNFIFNTNHKDGIAKTRNDRRIAAFMTAQQCMQDVIDADMGGRYFPDLYEWLREGGYAVVSELLHTRPIPPELNPATLCMRAPDTSTTEQMIREGLGAIEQEVLEAVDAGRPGFAGGWVSSVMLTALLKETGHRLSINKRRAMLNTLGYEWHPGLNEGRSVGIVMPDGGCPRLFIRNGHRDAGLHGVEVTRAYSAAQQAAPAAVPAGH